MSGEQVGEKLLLEPGDVLSPLREETSAPAVRPAAATTSSGRSSIPAIGDRVIAIARRTTFCSSRTLPGQW
jgi:hypothetical protein